MLRPQFTKDQVSDLALQEVHFQNLLRCLDPLMTDDGWIDKVDLLPYLFRLTLDTATEFLLGASANSQLRNLPDYKSKATAGSREVRLAEFVTAFDLSQEYIAKRQRLMNGYWLLCPKRFRHACRIVHDFVDHCVRLALDDNPARKEPEQSGGSDQKKYVFLEAMTDVTQDPIELRTQVMHVLIAGRDTTASLMGWGWYPLTLLQFTKPGIGADFQPS